MHIIVRRNKCSLMTFIEPKIKYAWNNEIEKLMLFIYEQKFISFVSLFAKKTVSSNKQNYLCVKVLNFRIFMDKINYTSLLRIDNLKPFIRFNLLFYKLPLFYIGLNYLKRRNFKFKFLEVLRFALLVSWIKMNIFITENNGINLLWSLNLFIFFLFNSYLLSYSL